ncbi:MAG: ABC transporter substrate-binding protein [Alphaproteobacteria bacterium]|nr:ABC transporter substrate-binding protein [Alphaproteobacteria bacterium]
MGVWWRWVAAMALLGFLGHPPPAAAESATLRIVVPLDLASLPLIVAAHDRLIEKQAEARGVQLDVQWLVPNGGNPVDELLRGQADIAATPDLGEFLLAWDRYTGSPQEIRGLAALARMPYQLLSRNPAIATIRDFTAKDRIAVPAVKTSLPAIMLEMAAANEWGAKQYDKLDALTVARNAEEADSALHGGKGEIDTDFARMPYADDERSDPAVHRVMDSFDIAGPHSVGAVLATGQFRDANPKICNALVDALTGVDAYIKSHRGGAAELYVRAAKEQGWQVEDLTDMLGDPDTSFETAPAGTLRLALFLHQIGRIKHKPDSWQAMFFPEIHKQPGS